MPRRPNPKSKTPRIVIEAKTEDELNKLRGLREVFSREEPGEMRRELWQAIDHVLAKHNWPPGNPQIQMTKFTQPRLVEKTCEHPSCQNVAQWIDFPKPPGKPKVYSCETHHTHGLENQLLKKSKRI